MGPHLVFSCLAFHELSPEQLYELLALRAAVFVVEQHCPYLDPDGKDYTARHLLGYVEKELAAYARLLPEPDGRAAIGRVVVQPEFRGRGWGRDLMQQAIAKAGADFNAHTIRISAQCYLIEFYQSLGFATRGEPYLEDDIPHIRMERAG